MGLTAKITDKVSLGGTLWEYHGTVQFDASYPTGGEAIDLTAASGIPGPSKLKYFYPQLPLAGGGIPIYDGPNAKLKLASAVAGTEATNASDQSAVIVPFRAIGAA